MNDIFKDYGEKGISEIFSDMNSSDFELYIYSLKKLAENNLENNKTFLTNLYNIRAFHYKAQEIMLENRQEKFAIVILDFSNFKSINEFCGREAGDGLLKATAKALLDEASDKVVVSHFRADTFAMLMPFNTETDIIEAIERIDEKIADFKLPYRVLPAFGVCIADSHNMAVPLMCDYAKMALNSIKGKFYAKYCFFDENMRKKMLLAKMIENDIVDALEAERLCIFIQPKVNMETGRVVGGEALVRWKFKGNKIVSPAEFIPVIEQNGLIIDVDIYVWTLVFKTIGGWFREGKNVVPISVNISRLHAFDTNFVDVLINLSKKYNVPPRLVTLELTESGFLENDREMFISIRKLKEYGFIISMDDFGTGYSTMTVLKDQPVDEIKIDKGFIDDITNSKCKSIIRHTVAMLRELGVSMIVEGVENREQMDFLLECGCTYAQGYYFYKPLSINEFEKLID